MKKSQNLTWDDIKKVFAESGRQIKESGRQMKETVRPVGKKMVVYDKSVKVFWLGD